MRSKAGRSPVVPAGRETAGEAGMFFVFSNSLGCLGSIAVSLVLTLVVLFLLGVF